MNDSFQNHDRPEGQEADLNSPQPSGYEYQYPGPQADVPPAPRSAPPPTTPYIPPPVYELPLEPLYTPRPAQPPAPPERASANPPVYPVPPIAGPGAEYDPP